MLIDFIFHVSALDSLHNDMEYVFATSWLGEVLSHEIVILYDVGMPEILSDAELGIHSPKLNTVLHISGVITSNRFIDVEFINEI